VSISQSWVTALSLFLVTLVRGALTFCVGTCFTQHLWGVLQREYASLKDIERMFHLRRSLFAILDPRALWKTPLLFSMGAYLWLITVALVYPPGAVIVSIDVRHEPRSLNMSVLRQRFPGDFDPLDYYLYPSLGELDLRSGNIEIFNSSTAEVRYFPGIFQ
jgi:hypothetical protein